MTDSPPTFADPMVQQAIAAEQAEWQRRVQSMHSIFAGDVSGPLNPMLKFPDEVTGGRSAAPSVELHVCNNGVPATRKFVAGPATDI